MNDIGYEFKYLFRTNLSTVVDVDIDAYAKAQAKGAFYLRALQQFLYSNNPMQTQTYCCKRFRQCWQ